MVWYQNGASVVGVAAGTGRINGSGIIINHPYQYQLLLLQSRKISTAFAKKSSGGFSINSVFKSCKKCEGKGAIDCPGCKGTGKNKKNGNIFERWKCFECQGFGLKSCPECGKGGLTPEQRGER